MARGRLVEGGCSNDCSPACHDTRIIFPHDPADPTTTAHDQRADVVLEADPPMGREIIVTTVERDVNGDAIGVELVRLGSGKLILTASASAILISCGAPGPVVTGSDDTFRPTTSSRAGSAGEGGPLSGPEYRDALSATCREKAAKLERVHAANPDATPIRELMDVLQEQLAQITALNPPTELTDKHTDLVTAYRDRVALLSRVSTNDDANDDQRDALLAQADAFAVQVDDAYRAIGVPECAS